MSIININKLTEAVGDDNHYSYVRITNMLRGLKGRSTKKDIQAVRRVIERELTEAVIILKKLEDEATKTKQP